jgi:hypothetical protein
LHHHDFGGRRDRGGQFILHFKKTYLAFLESQDRVYFPVRYAEITQAALHRGFTLFSAAYHRQHGLIRLTGYAQELVARPQEREKRRP